MTKTAADFQPVMPGLVPEAHLFDEAETVPAVSRRDGAARTAGDPVPAKKSLAILHVFRAPVGGLFRRPATVSASSPTR